MVESNKVEIFPDEKENSEALDLFFYTDECLRLLPQVVSIHLNDNLLRQNFSPKDGLHDIPEKRAVEGW